MGDVIFRRLAAPVPPVALGLGSEAGGSRFVPFFVVAFLRCFGEGFVPGDRLNSGVEPFFAFALGLSPFLFFERVPVIVTQGSVESFCDFDDSRQDIETMIYR